MTNKLTYLQLRTLDKHLATIHVLNRPSSGWIQAIRKSLGMNTRQLAEHLNITSQSLAKLEENELENSITLRSLTKVAEAMDCKLVYALIPNEGSLGAIVKKQAYKKAKLLVTAVDHTMKLEAQDVGNLEERIQEEAEELARNPNSKLWEK